MHKFGLYALILLGSAVCLTPVASAQYAPIPPPRYEMPPPPPPGPRMLWQRGAWEWTGRGYVWRPGHYVAWRARYHRWVPGHWARRGRGPVWIPAHWR